MVDDADLAGRVSAALLDLCELDGGAGHVEPPRGYAHLGLAIVDSVYSLRAKYESHVVPVVNAYCRVIPGLMSPDARFQEGEHEHGVPDLMAATEGKTEEELIALFGGNRQTAPGTRIRKAVVARDVARALSSVDVFRRADLEREWKTGMAERAVLRVKGVGDAAWRYILSLSQIERVKPDTMVTRWVREVTSLPDLDAARAAGLLESAAAELGGSVLTVRAADHLVWRFESGRLQTSSRRRRV